MRFSIIIPNYNGLALLQENLPVVLKCGADEVLVVDDGSSDQSAAFLDTLTPQITFLKNEKNLGYAHTVNKGMEQASGDVCVLLNTDVKPDKNFLQALKPHFEKDNVFAVNCHETDHAWASGEFINGYVHHHSDHDQSQAHISFYASGGSAAFSRKKFLELGSYDTLFHPFYWEDTDISYRAWKRGYEIWWEPNSHVDHQTSSTIKKYFNKNKIDFIVERNELFFLWKNITDDDLFTQHKKALINRIAKNPGYVKPVFGALKHLNQIKQRRSIEIIESVKTDKEIFSLFSTNRTGE